MEQPQRKQNPLETEPIGRLIRRYSIPTALTLMVNYLYNIVDQIFVGQGVGVTGMAATNVAFPLTIVTIALALMIGDGCAANMSLCLGRRQQEEADRDRQPYRDPAGGRRGFPGGGGKPVRPADCPAVRGHGDGFSGVSGLYPDHRLGAALPAL